MKFSCVFHSFMLYMEVQCTAWCSLGLDLPKQRYLVRTTVWRSINTDSLGTRRVESTSESLDKRLIWWALFILVNQAKWVNQVKREPRSHWLTHSSTRANHLITSIKMHDAVKSPCFSCRDHLSVSIMYSLCFIQLDHYCQGICICSCHHYLII